MKKWQFFRKHHHYEKVFQNYDETYFWNTFLMNFQIASQGGWIKVPGKSDRSERSSSR